MSNYETIETLDTTPTESANIAEKIEVIQAATPTSSELQEAHLNSVIDDVTDALAVEPPVSTAALYNAVAQEIVEQKPVEIPVGQVLTPPPAPVDPYQLPLSVSASSRLTVDELKDYISKMSSKLRMTTADGGQVQSNLYHILIQAINTRAEDFDVTFGLAMKLIRDNLKGVFSMENMHRYTPYATLPAKTMAHFRYLLSVLTALADPSIAREAMRQTNLDRAFRSPGIKEEARQRVLNYFNV